MRGDQEVVEEQVYRVGTGIGGQVGDLNLANIAVPQLRPRQLDGFSAKHVVVGIADDEGDGDGLGDAGIRICRQGACAACL